MKANTFSRSATASVAQRAETEQMLAAIRTNLARIDADQEETRILREGTDESITRIFRALEATR